MAMIALGQRNTLGVVAGAGIVYLNPIGVFYPNVGTAPKTDEASLGAMLVNIIHEDAHVDQILHMGGYDSNACIIAPNARTTHRYIEYDAINRSKAMIDAFRDALSPGTLSTIDASIRYSYEYYEPNAAKCP
jgi:hypothetical protein